jgi:hypothetical protein
MSTVDISKVIEAMVSKHNLAVETLTEHQLAEAIRQAIAAGDFTRFVRTDGAQSVVYLPFQGIDALREREKLHLEYEKLLGEELDEVVHYAASHGWKSSRYQQGVELRRKLGIPKENDPNHSETLNS